MEFQDLHEFKKGHPPSPYAKPVFVVKIGDGMLPKGLTLRAVGWLEREGFQTGITAKECIQLLVDALRESIFRDGYRGLHACTFCGECQPVIKWKRKKITLFAAGHYLVLHRKTVYMAPASILHYMLGHDYRPPDEFLQAILKGRFLSEDDLQVTWRQPGKGRDEP